MRILLTGATGYVGSHLLRRLAQMGLAVTAIARPRPHAELWQHELVQWRFADLRDVAAVTDLALESAAVLHTAADHWGEMEEVDRIATGALAAGLAGSGKPFISTSATVVYGDTGPTPRGEDGAILSPLPSRAWRDVHDRQVVALAAQGIRGAVIRPPSIHGYDGGFIRRRIDAARQTGVATYVGDGGAMWSNVHLDDLADLFLLILRNPGAAGIYNAASDEVIGRRMLAELIAAIFGPGIVARSIDLTTATAESGDFAAMGTINQVISSDRARRELAWSPSGPSLVEDLRCGSYQSSNA